MFFLLIIVNNHILPSLMPLKLYQKCLYFQSRSSNNFNTQKTKGRNKGNYKFMCYEMSDCKS